LTARWSNSPGPTGTAARRGIGAAIRAVALAWITLDEREQARLVDPNGEPGEPQIVWPIEPRH
jgi:hypothetical protein